MDKKGEMVRYIKVDLLLFVLLNLFLAISSFAENIVLKSGKIIDKKIIEKTDDYIKVDISGVPITYYLDDLESINGIKVVLPVKIKKEPLIEINTSASGKDLADSSEEKADEELLKYGIKFIFPSGWTKTKNTKAKGAELVGYAAPKEGALIQVFLPFRSTLKDYQKTLSRNRKNNKYIFEKEIRLLEVPCQIYSRDTKTEHGIVRMKTYLFFKNNLMYSMSYIALLKDRFNEYLSDFEESLGKLEVNTQGYFEHMSGLFKIIPPEGFTIKKHFQDGVVFDVVYPAYPAIFQITLIECENGYADEELLAVLDDKSVRQDHINFIEEQGREYGMEVTGSRKRLINGISAWEFFINGKKFILSMKAKSIVFYKNNRQFTIYFSTHPEFYEDLEKDVETALKTLKIEESN